jgi:hypothetical protein
MAALLAVIGIVVLTVGLMFVVYPLYGWVLTKLWFWFAVPLGFPQLTLMQAIGVILLVAFLTGQPATNRKKDKEEQMKDLTAALIRPFMYLAIGYVAHLFM